MSWDYVLNSPVDSRTGDPVVNRQWEMALNISKGCSAGDESKISAQARKASTQADKLSDNANDCGGHKAAASAHLAAASAHDNCSKQHSSDIAAQQHGAAAAQHLRKAQSHMSKATNNDDDEVTTNNSKRPSVAIDQHGKPTPVLNCAGSDEDLEMIPPTINWSETANARRQRKTRDDSYQQGDSAAGLGARGGASGRRAGSVNDRQAMGDVAPNPDFDEYEDPQDEEYDSDQADDNNGNYSVDLRTGKGVPGHQPMHDEQMGADWRKPITLDDAETTYPDSGMDARTQRILDSDEDETDYSTVRGSRSMIPEGPVGVAAADAKRRMKLAAVERDRENQRRAKLRS